MTLLDFKGMPGELFGNPAWRPSRLWPVDQAWLTVDGCDKACAEIADWPFYVPTRLKSLDRLAAAAGVAAIDYKDENGRFGQQSFKTLGAPFALATMAAERLAAADGGRPSTAELMSGVFRSQAAPLTCAAATDGNHGRALAWAAGLIGCRAVVYVHHQVSAGRQAAIAALGAEVIVVDGTYDDSVRRCTEDCRRHGWLEINDAGPADDLVSTRLIMQGYSLMIDEILAERPQAPTHVFVQAGVGGFAAATAARLWQRLGDTRCRVVVVEPQTAACLNATARAGQLTPATGDLDTLMAGLACGEASFLGWQILKDAAFAYLAIPDAAAVAAMRLLASDLCSGTVAGETGASGTAGAMVALADPVLRDALGVDASSRLLLFGTEGATDPVLYARYVG